LNNQYIIAGCNGAGKTTASFTVLPEMLNCGEFVNADEIARGLSTFNPDKAAIEAGRLMLKKIDDLMGVKVDFAFETTLSSRSFVNTISKAKESGYQVTLLFFWLESVNLAIERVKIRVEEGGHNIPEDVIRRRYYSGLKNFFQLYLSKCDYWMLIDNSKMKQIIVAEGSKDTKTEIINSITFDKILNLTK